MLAPKDRLRRAEAVCCLVALGSAAEAMIERAVGEEADTSPQAARARRGGLLRCLAYIAGANGWGIMPEEGFARLDAAARAAYADSIAALPHAPFTSVPQPDWTVLADQVALLTVVARNGGLEYLVLCAAEEMFAPLCLWQAMRADGIGSTVLEPRSPLDQAASALVTALLDRGAVGAFVLDALKREGEGWDEHVEENAARIAHRLPDDLLGRFVYVLASGDRPAPVDAPEDDFDRSRRAVARALPPMVAAALRAEQRRRQAVKTAAKRAATPERDLMSGIIASIRTLVQDDGCQEVRPDAPVTMVVDNAVLSDHLFAAVVVHRTGLVPVALVPVALGDAFGPSDVVQFGVLQADGSVVSEDGREEGRSWRKRLGAGSGEALAIREVTTIMLQDAAHGGRREPLSASAIERSERRLDAMIATGLIDRSFAETPAPAVS